MKNPKITTAIIPVAGYGTRRLPITKSIEKCMLPVGNRPIVDYVVADCVAAGISEIYFVVGANSAQIREYFGRNLALENYLIERKKFAELAQILPRGFYFDERSGEILEENSEDSAKNNSVISSEAEKSEIAKRDSSTSKSDKSDFSALNDTKLSRENYKNKIDKNSKNSAKKIDENSAKKINFHFVIQPQNGKYGTTIPVEIALREIAKTREISSFSESILVVMGDDFLYNSPRKLQNNDIENLLNSCENSRDAAMLAVKIPREKTANYGVLKLDENGNFAEIVEKPAPENAPSDLINISKYVFPPRLQDLILQFSRDEFCQPSGEFYITDPINEFVKSGGIMKVVENRGEYLDGGNLAGWLRANEVVGRDLA